MALLDFQNLVTDFVRDTGTTITTEQRDRAIELARLRYSADRPRLTAKAVVADGSDMLSLPDGWEIDFSRLSEIKVEGRGKFLGQLELTFDGHVIRLDESLSAGTTAHVWFTVTQLLDSEDDTINPVDREAVSNWAAALLLEQMASHYSGHKRPTIQGDSVDWDNKGRDYASRAKRLRQLYFDHLGIDPKRNAAAGVVVDMDRGSMDGGGRMVHSQRRR